MKIRRYFGTLCGLILGVLSLLIWILTFEPHGGPELSWYLFPISRLVLDWLFPRESIPAVLWFGGALLQWIVLGAAVDLLRQFAEKRTKKE